MKFPFGGLLLSTGYSVLDAILYVVITTILAYALLRIVRHRRNERIRKERERNLAFIKQLNDALHPQFGPLKIEKVEKLDI